MRSAEVITLMNRRTPQQFAALIREKDAGTVAAIFATAVMVETAHEELGPAQWLIMVREELKWSKSTGYKYLKIAQCDHLSEVFHERLPSDWNAISSLASLTSEQFTTGLDTGVIHSGMARADVAKLKPPKPRRVKPDVVATQPPTDDDLPPPPPIIAVGKRNKAIPLADFCSMEVRRLCFETVQEIQPEQLEAFFAEIEAQIADLKAKTLGAE